MLAEAPPHMPSTAGTQGAQTPDFTGMVAHVITQSVMLLGSVTNIGMTGGIVTLLARR